MKNKFEQKKLIDLIQGELSLPSPPAIAVQILNAVQEDEVALTRLAEIIAKDPALSAKVLRVANSGIFACISEVSSISRATSVLGTTLVKNIALSFILTQEFKDRSQTIFDFDRFWKKSVVVASIADLICKEVSFPNPDIFVSGLLQEIGMAVIFLSKGHAYTALLEKVANNSAALIASETATFGYNHQEVAYALFCSWNIPACIVDPVLYHHCPEEAPESVRTSVEILFLADCLSELYLSPEKSGPAKFFQQRIAAKFSLSEEQIFGLMDAAAVLSNQMIECLEIAPGDLQSYSQILNEANRELSKLNLESGQVILEMKEAQVREKRLTRELEEANAKLNLLAKIDPLTGLHNQRYFMESLEHEIDRVKRYQTSLSVLLFDIDFFSGVIEKYDYEVGDLVIQNIAKAICSAVRSNDIVGRICGDQFAVLLPNSSAAGAKVFASRTKLCAEGVVTIMEGERIYVTISAGTTTVIPSANLPNQTDVFNTIKHALSLSKQAGRNQVTALTPEEYLAL